MTNYVNEMMAFILESLENIWVEKMITIYPRPTMFSKALLFKGVKKIRIAWKRVYVNKNIVL